VDDHYRKQPGDGFVKPTVVLEQDGVWLTRQECVKEEARLASVEMEKIRRAARREADADEVRLRVVRSRRASEFTARNPRWLWATEQGEFGRIPINALTLLVGKGGVGKSTLECTWAAWITRGEMKGHYFGTPKDVLFIPYEDHVEETIKPRLMAAGADLDRVHFLTMEDLGIANEGDVLLPTDCDAIAERAAKLNAVAVFVDPISAALRVDNSNDAKKVRAAAQAVQQMARDHHLSVIGVMHTRKALTTNLMDSIMGSSEMGNVSRAAIGLMADQDQPGTIVLSQEKCNGGRLDIPGYRYRIDSADVYEGGQLIRSSSLVFIDKVEPQAVTTMMEEQASGGNQGRTASQEARDFIWDYLMSHGGESQRSDVIKAAKSEMLSCSVPTLDRAAKSLGVTGHVPGNRRHWSVPSSIKS
jgi:hypothetical protein